MAYVPTEWQTGDVIDAEKLNHAEEGIAAANASYPGYDAVIKIEIAGVEDITASAIKGDFAEVMAKIAAGDLVNIKMYEVRTGDAIDEIYGTRYIVYPSEVVVMADQINISGIANQGTAQMTVYWTADGIEIE